MYHLGFSPTISRTGEREKLGCDGASTEASTLRSFIAARVAGSRQGLYFSAVSWGSQGRGQDFGEAAVYSGGDAREGSEGNTPGSWRTAACISERDLNGHPSVQHSSIGDTACDHRGWAGLPVRGLETRTERHRQTEPGGGGFQGASRAAPGKSGLHVRGEGEHVMALESREGTSASRILQFSANHLL